MHRKTTKTIGFAYQQGMLLAELDENKEAIRHYIPGNAYIGVDNSYYLTDEQGSVRYVLSADANANVQNTYQYDAFGENVARDERIPNRLKYNAQIEDELTGLYYLRARYYNASLGRFTQEDIIYNDGLNLYAYCGSNPVMYCDPSGYAKKLTCNIKENDAERKETLNQIKKDLGLNKNASPVKQHMTILKNESGAPVVHNGKMIYSREMTYDVRGLNLRDKKRNKPIEYVVVQDHSYGHFYKNGVGNQTSHFNVRPSFDVKNGKVKGIKEHYYFKVKYKWK